MNIVIGEIVEVKINGGWFEAEVLDISGNYAYLYIFATHGRLNASLTHIRTAR